MTVKDMNFRGFKQCRGGGEALRDCRHRMKQGCTAFGLNAVETYQHVGKDEGPHCYVSTA